MANQKPDVDPIAGDPPADLVIEDITVGDGQEAEAGQLVSVHYVGVAPPPARSSTRPGTAASRSASRSAAAGSSPAGTRAWPA